MNGNAYHFSLSVTCRVDDMFGSGVITQSTV